MIRAGPWPYSREPCNPDGPSRGASHVRVPHRLRHPRVAPSCDRAPWHPGPQPADNGTFIPVGSALAINDISLYSQDDLFIDFQTDPHPSDLGNTYADTANNPHVTVTAGIASFLLTMVGNARGNAAA